MSSLFRVDHALAQDHIGIKRKFARRNDRMRGTDAGIKRLA